MLFRSIFRQIPRSNININVSRTFDGQKQDNDPHAHTREQREMASGSATCNGLLASEIIPHCDPACSGAAATIGHRKSPRTDFCRSILFH